MTIEKEKIIESYDRLATMSASWKKKNAYYHEEQLKYLRFLIPEGLSVLDLGCGNGDLLHGLQPKRGVGVDFSQDMIENAKERYPELEFRHDDIENLKGWGESFDIILLADVVGHLLDIEQTFKRLNEFCIPETRVVICYYNFLWEPILKAGEALGLKMPQNYQNWLSSEDIDNILMLSNFQVVKSESRLLMPKKIPLLSNFINRYIASLPGFRALSLCRYIVARPAAQKNQHAFSTSIIVPCRNEKGNIEQAIQRIPSFCENQEIIFVEGNSTDGTKEEISRVVDCYPDKNIRLLVQDGKGKGDAVRKGFDAANGDILMILDADLTVPPEDLPKFYVALTENHGEFINGCRLVYPMEKQAMRFLNLLGNKFFSMMFTWILNQRFKDTLCGTKVLFKKDYEKIKKNRGYFGEFDPFGDFDLIFGAVKQNLKVVEIPIRYQERTYGSTNISRFRHGWLLLKMTAFAYKKIKSI
jgi:ubiquinone/menaquinone biosynthesis C-methylase UbiE